MWWRLLKRVAVDVAIMLGINWVMESSSNNRQDGNISSYEEPYYIDSVYESSDVKELESKIDEYEISPYEFTVNDLSNSFMGSYNNRASTINFTDIEFSKDKDTLFFDFDMFYLNENLTLDLCEGTGFIVSSEELIILMKDTDSTELVGIALKIYNDQYSDENEDGYLFFNINEESDKLSFIDKKLKEEFGN